MATPFTSQQLAAAGANPNMYQAPTFAPPSPTYAIQGTSDFTTNPQQAILNQQSGDNNLVSVPGVGMVPRGTYGTQATGTPGVNPQPYPQQVQVGRPSPQSVNATPFTQGVTPQPNQQAIQPSPVIKNVETPAADPTGQKYQQAFQNLQENGGAAPTSQGEARVAVNQSAAQYQRPSEAPVASPQFIQYGDPVMRLFIQSALAQKQDIIDKGATATALKATLGNQLANLRTDELNLHNIINGSVVDIRNEIAKAGGFATESQIQGLAATRNVDLIRQLNSMQIQEQNMQNNMSMQVQLADMDRQYAQDTYQNTMQAATLYRNIYDNTTDQMKNLVNQYGLSGLSKLYGNDPYVLGLAEQHLALPQGTLSDPNRAAVAESYRQRSLDLAYARTYGYMPGQGISQNATLPTGGVPSTANGGTNTNGASYAQYGLLSKTDFNPQNQVDQQAMNYLNAYLNNGRVPTQSDIGLKGSGAIVSGQFTNITQRANNLYFAATGENLPSPEVVKSNLGLITANNKLQNNLSIQEQTINKNFGLSLQNLTANNINNAYPVLNNVINSISNALGDPNTAQLFAQNSTLQQELGSLLAVKNASGTTVYDKLAGAGLLPANATPQQQIQVVKTLLQEAQNAANVIKQVNGDLYKSVDPLERMTNNPNREASLAGQKGFIINGLVVTGPDGSHLTFPNQEALNKFKKDQGL